MRPRFFAAIFFSVVLTPACKTPLRANPVTSPGQEGDGSVNDATAGSRDHDGTQVLVAALTVLEKGHSPDVLSETLRVPLQKSDTEGWWRLVVSDAVEVLVHAKESGKPILEADIHYQLGTFSLEDAVGVLGAYKIVAESKTSTVMFLDLAPRQLVVYASLFSSKAVKAAAVTSVSLRRR